MPKKTQKNIVLILITGISFILSFWVFVYFLVNTNVSRSEAKESTYSVDQVIVAVNIERKKSNLKELTINDKLSKSAQSKADHLAQYKYFSHIHGETGKRWSDFIKEENYDYQVAGENLANGFYNVEDMVKAWMNSPTHRENIMNTLVDETGVGISFGELNGTPTVFVVQHFGKV